MVSIRIRGQMLISIVVPVYNNCGTLRKTFEQIDEQFRTHLPGDLFEVVFVNDGSKDESLTELMELRTQYPQAKVLAFTRNFGQNAAMAAGNRHAKGDCVIVINADLQDPVDLMPHMIKKWKEGFKIVLCAREERQESAYRKIPAAIYYFLLRLSVPIYPKKGTDYYLIDRAVVDIINPYSNRNSFMTFDILETGYDFYTFSYVRREREVGVSGYNFFKRLKHMYDNLINASYLPIRMMSVCGVVTASSGFIYAAMVAYSRIFNGTLNFPGYAPIVILILISSGMIMIMLGIIGEYLWRAFDYIKARPDYVIRERHLS